MKIATVYIAICSRAKASGETGVIRAEEIADPGTMFLLLLLIAFLTGIAVHTVFRARHVIWISVIATVVFIVVLFTTIYRDAPSQDALWLIGLIISFVANLGAIIGAGLLVRRLRQ